MKNRLSLQEALDHPGVEAVIFAECGGKTLQVRQIDESLYILEDLPDQTFTSVEALEKAIQSQCPSYSKDACIWYDEWMM